MSHPMDEGWPAQRDATTAPVDSDDDSEWEYEYSTTETETHLITLDLSIPDFVRQRNDYVIHNTRGGFRSWLSRVNLDDVQPKISQPRAADTSVRKKGGARAKATAARAGVGGANANAVADADADDDDGDLMGLEDNYYGGKPDGDGAARDAADNAGGGSPPPDEPDPTEIQILELHAREPIIAYRGMLFRGTWADTIGTEMLFMAGDHGSMAPDGPSALPSPIHLPQNVDLVGASSARITCAPVELRARNATDRAGTRGTAQRRVGFKIPVGNGASAQRQKQASFLEALMAVKHQHGEEDVVTVQAVDTKHNAVHDDMEEVKRRERIAVQSAVNKRRRGLDGYADAGAASTGAGPGPGPGTGTGAQAGVLADSGTGDGDGDGTGPAPEGVGKDGTAQGEAAASLDQDGGPPAPRPRASTRGWKKARTSIERVAGQSGSSHIGPARGERQDGR